MIYFALRFWRERRACEYATRYIGRRRMRGKKAPPRESIERRVR